jgi:hypothetical protein
MKVHVATLSTQITDASFRRKWLARQDVHPKGEMRITFVDLGPSHRERLRERLESAGRLKCTEHEQGVIAVTLNGRENGWFDSRWTVCCEGLERQAVAIVKARC